MVKSLQLRPPWSLSLGEITIDVIEAFVDTVQSCYINVSLGLRNPKRVPYIHNLQYVFDGIGLKAFLRIKPENYEGQSYPFTINNHIVSYSLFSLVAVKGSRRLKGKGSGDDNTKLFQRFLSRKGHPTLAKSSSALKTKCSVGEKWRLLTEGTRSEREPLFRS